MPARLRREVSPGVSGVFMRIRRPRSFALRRLTTPAPALAVALAAGSLLSAGCSSGSRERAGPVTAADFYAQPAPVAPATAPPTSAGAAPGAASAGSTSPGAKSPTVARASAPTPLPPPIPDAVAVPGSPPLESLPDAKPVGKPVIVEAVVGQINGKPVFASEVLGKMDNAMRRQAAESRTLNDFIDKAGRMIVEELQRQIADELFLAEARASLTPEQRKGLLQFVSNLQENLTSTFQGSSMVADERLLLEEGKTLEEKVQDERDQMLIRVLVNRHITPRVNVSWRDVEKAYARQSEQYNAPTKATIRVVRAPTGDAARVKALADALAARPMEDVAKDRAVNDFLAGEGGVIQPTFRGLYSEARLSGERELNEQLQKLERGQIVGPFTWSRWTAWARLENLETPEGVPLVDAQLELFSALRAERMKVETDKYLQRLYKNASSSGPREMQIKLIVLAVERYWAPTGKPGLR